MKIDRGKRLGFREENGKVWALLAVNPQGAKPEQLVRFTERYAVATTEQSLTAEFDPAKATVRVLLPMGYPEKVASVLEQAIELFRAAEAEDAPKRKGHQEDVDRVQAAATEWWGVEAAVPRRPASKKPWKSPPW